jgi:uncharacterized protein YcbX
LRRNQRYRRFSDGNWAHNHCDWRIKSVVQATFPIEGRLHDAIDMRGFRPNVFLSFAASATSLAGSPGLGLAVGQLSAYLST